MNYEYEEAYSKKQRTGNCTKVEKKNPRLLINSPKADVNKITR